MDQAHRPRPAPGPRTAAAVRLDRHRVEVLQLLDNPRVPVDNQAERDLRMVKQHKISGCWRTLAGEPAFLTVRSHVSTARNHEVDG